MPIIRFDRNAGVTLYDAAVTHSSTDQGKDKWTIDCRHLIWENKSFSDVETLMDFLDSKRAIAIAPDDRDRIANLPLGHTTVVTIGVYLGLSAMFRVNIRQQVDFVVGNGSEVAIRGTGMTINHACKLINDQMKKHVIATECGVQLTVDPKDLTKVNDYTYQYDFD